MILKFMLIALISASSMSFAENISRQNRFSKLHHKFFVSEDDYRLGIIKNNINKHNRFINDPQILAYKYRAMANSTYSFFRATNHLMHADIQSSEIELPEGWNDKSHASWITADMHVQNVSFWDTKQKLNSKTVYFLDDFDESLVLPVTVDLFRYLVSLELFMDQLKFRVSRHERLNVLDDFIRTYRKVLRKTKEQKIKQSPFLQMRQELKKVKLSKVQQKLLKKWTILGSGKRQFNMQNSKLALVSPNEEEMIRRRWRLLQLKLPHAKAKQLDILDVKARIFSGLGSLGVKRFYLLTEGESTSANDDLILELKQQLPSSVAVNNPSLLSKFKNHYPKNEALRNLSAQQALYGALFPFQTDLRFDGNYYLVRQMLPYVGSVKTKRIQSLNALRTHIKCASKVIAKSHLRARYSLQFDSNKFRKKLSRYLENNISSLVYKSVEYANTVRKDHVLFAKNIDEVLNESNR